VGLKHGKDRRILLSRHWPHQSNHRAGAPSPAAGSHSVIDGIADIEAPVKAADDFHGSEVD